MTTKTLLTVALQSVFAILDRFRLSDSMITKTRTTKAEKKTMPISKLGQRRQVVIPKDICDALSLDTGDFVEVKQVKGDVVITPKKLVDADLILTAEEKALVKAGERELRKGKSRSWEAIKHDMELT